MKNIINAIFYCCLICFYQHSMANEAPAIQLAKKYKLQHNINQYLVSEKLDGIRGYWNGHKLLTKNGNKLNTPKWYTHKWPNQIVEGELWAGRNTFEQVASCIRKKEADLCWHNIHFMVFDLPQNTQPFSIRANAINQLAKKVNSIYFRAIRQFKLPSIKALNEELESVVSQKGEGLMLHYQHAYYTVGRTNNIMKLKPYQDAEGLVIKHLKGKGKYKNMLGAVQVKTKEGIIFKIGTGFTDKERESPPPIGSTITFKHIGKTQRGVPKFASFLRVKPKGS